MAYADPNVQAGRKRERSLEDISAEAPDKRKRKLRSSVTTEADERLVCSRQKPVGLVPKKGEPETGIPGERQQVGELPSHWQPTWDPLLNDTIMDEATQPSTQPYNDPRRVGRNNSGMSKDDIVDVICILHPMNALAMEVVKKMMVVDPGHVLQNDDLLHGFDPDDLQTNLMMQSPGFERDLALRMTSPLKDAATGFTFGRNRSRCDILLADEKDKNVSNVHFSISLNENGILMLEDLSTNGTAVDGHWYRKTAGPKNATTMLQPNASISVLTKTKVSRNQETVNFMVRYPSRGEYTELYNERLRTYIAEQPGMEGTTVPKVSSYDTNFGMHWDGGSDYNVVGHLGKGAFATVYKLATKRDGKVFAAKELDKRRFMKNGILDLKVDNEMRIMATLRHPNIVQYEDYYDFQHWIYIIMEYVPGGELSTHITRHGPVPERVGQDITRQILHALEYLHRRGITHRDIKPDNMLIANYQPLTVKLSDFGLSKCVQNQETFLKTFCGTLLYCAPEVYPDYSSYRTNTPNTPGVKRRRDPRLKTSPYSQAVDMWSFGAVLYHILCNKPPVMGKGDDRGIHMLNNIMTKSVDYSPLRQMDISEQAIDFINQLLNRDPQQRPTEKECFQHEWIVNIADQQDYSKVDNDYEAQEGLAAIAELEEDVWDAEEPADYVDSGKENVTPDQAQDEMGLLEDRNDPRYQSKRQRLRGGGPSETTSDVVKYPSLPKLDPSPTTSPNKRSQRLFGEIPQSAFQSSDVFAPFQGELSDLPFLRRSVEKISVSDFPLPPGEDIADSEASTKYEYQERIPAVVRRGPQSAAPSLFGAESDMRDLNMSSEEGYEDGGTTPDSPPDSRDAATPGTKTREATPTETEPLQQPTANDMAPPPLPGGPRRKSIPEIEDVPPVIASTRPLSKVPDTMVTIDGSTSEGQLRNEDIPQTSKDQSPKNIAEAKAPVVVAANTGPSSTTVDSKSGAAVPPSIATSNISAGNSAVDMPRRLGRFFAVPGSIITADLPITSIRTVYGRGIDSTHKFPNVYDTRIPKYGLKLTFHSEEITDIPTYLTSGHPFTSILGLYVSVTTSATRGIDVNGIHLPHQDTKKNGWYWGQVQTGDIITLYEGEDKAGHREHLKFQIEINYGDSAKMRSADEPFRVMWSQKLTSGGGGEEKGGKEKAAAAAANAPAVVVTTATSTTTSTAAAPSNT